MQDGRAPRCVGVFFFDNSLTFYFLRVKNRAPAAVQVRLPVIVSKLATRILKLLLDYN